MDIDEQIAVLEVIKKEDEQRGFQTRIAGLEAALRSLKVLKNVLLLRAQIEYNRTALRDLIDAIKSDYTSYGRVASQTVAFYVRKGEEVLDGRNELMYEDDLPESITDAEYAEWFKKSIIVDGVRMGPKI